MPTAFLSHTSKDGYFSTLLTDLLLFRDVDVWAAPNRLRPGDEFEREILGALARADALLVVVSKHAAGSSWVATEVSRFLAVKPGSPVLPLLLDGTAPELVAPGLGRRHSLDFQSCMRTAFVDLLAHFDREFLSRRQFQRTTPRAAQRRSGADRRVQDERRASSTQQRLRRGCWIAYSRETSYGKFEDVPLRIKELRQVEATLLTEVERYCFFDGDDREIEPGRALSESVYAEWEEAQERSTGSRFLSGTFKPIYLIEGIAERLSSAYRVEQRDRRSGEDRRIVKERREAP